MTLLTFGGLGNTSNKVPFFILGKREKGGLFRLFHLISLAGGADTSELKGNLVSWNWVKKDIFLLLQRNALDDRPTSRLYTGKMTKKKFL